MMSDEEYSTKEERRQSQSRSQRPRRAHNMSSRSDEEDDATGDTDRSDRDKEDEPDSAEELIAKVGTKCKTLIHDNVSRQDVAGPQLSKEGVKEAMKGAKRVDEIARNKTILDHYHNVKTGD